MKRMQKMIQRMKKSSNEGFSLVELIIVISIMAILMGVVATQVIPYLNKSRESNDNQILSKMHTAAVSAFAFCADEVKNEDYTITMSSTGDAVSSSDIDNVVIEMKNLMGVTSGSMFAYFKGEASSKDGSACDKIEIKYNGSTTGDGKITIQAYKSSSPILKFIESK